MTEQEEIVQSQLRAKKSTEIIMRTLPAHLIAQEEQLVERFAKHTGNTFSKLHSLYEFMDGLLEFIQKFTPCKKGCSHCCHIDVSISELEAEYIRKHEGVKPATRSIARGAYGSPCPFLKKGSCSIYKSRPFFCRRHVILDDSARWCHIDVCNNVKFSFPRFTEVDAVYDILLSESGLNKRFDIREVFAARLK